MEKDFLVKLATEIVKENIEKIGKIFWNLAKDKLNTEKIQFGEAFIKYLENAIEKYSIVKTILYNRNPVDIKDFFVNMNLMHNKKLIVTNDINNIFVLGKYNLIVGSGGLGKSTLMKYLFLNTIEKTRLIPIFVELKDLNGTNDNIYDCLFRSLHNLGFDLSKEYLIKALELGIFILFLDGFDEIDNNKRHSISQEINLMGDKYKDNFFFVSSRYSEDFISWTRFKELSIVPLSKKQAKLMINKLDYDTVLKETFVKELDKTLYKKYTSFASNPLLLTIMFMTYNQYAEIPEKIHEFFGAALDVLYKQHDAAKGLKRDKYTKLSSTEFKKILYIVSTISYIENKISFSNDKLLNYISTAKQIENIDFDEDCFKEDLVKSVCILVEDGLQYKYAHRSFQEYFTAKYIESCNDDDQKNILKNIYIKKPDSINEDFVYSTLFDINKSILERGILIDVLEELKKLTNDETEEKSKLKYIKLFFSRVELDLTAIGNFEGIETEEDAVFFICKKNPIREIVEFINRQYPSIYEKEKFIPNKESAAVIKQYGTYDDNGLYIVDLDLVEYGTELCDFILKTTWITIDYNYLFKILDSIKAVSQKNKSIKDLFFKI